MDFTFTEEQQMMAGAFRELAADICARAALRALYDGHDRAAEERWARLAEMGLFGVLATEADGGMGLSDADFVLLAEEAGRAPCPSPWWIRRAWPWRRCASWQPYRRSRQCCRSWPPALRASPWSTRATHMPGHRRP